MKMTTRFLALSLSATLLSSPAFAAAQQCTSKVTSIWAGDGGAVWLHFQNGMVAAVASTDPNVKNILSLATSALLADKQVTVRYDTTQGAAVCNPVNVSNYASIPVLGIYLHVN